MLKQDRPQCAPRGATRERSRRRPAAAGLIGLTALCVDAGAGPPHPPLPTPCLAGNCGSAAQSFVQYGAATAVTAGHTMDVTPSTGKVILNWANFNIASGYKVAFNQPGATAAALNQIWRADPSVVSGHLTPDGQAYT